MEIWRGGVRRSTGWWHLVNESDTEVYEQKVEWDTTFRAVTLTKTNVDDPNSKYSQYVYKVFLTLNDIAHILEELAEHGIKQLPAEIESTLKPSTVALLRIALGAQGYASEASDALNTQDNRGEQRLADED